MFDQNRLLTLFFSALILVESQRTKWTDDNDACIYKNNNQEIENIYNMAKCKALCEKQQGCRSVELYHKFNKCMLSRASSRTNDLIEPCTLQSVTYSEIIDNTGDVQANNQGVRNGGSGEELIFNRDISQGSGVTGNTQSINQAGVTGGANQGSVAQGGKQNESDQGSNQEGGLSVVSKSCNNKSNCKDNELCEKGNCVSPCDLIECGQGAICILIDGTAQPQCNCPAKTTGNAFVQCTPIQDNTVNDKTQPNPGLGRPVASVSENVASVTQKPASVKNPPASTSENVSSVTQKPASVINPPASTSEKVASVTQKPASVINPPASTSGTNPDISFPDERNQTQSVQARLQGCETDPDPGECRGAFPRYYFNKAKDQCDCFLFGGCDIEGVRFTWPTFDECLNKCVPLNTTKGSGCKRVSVDEVKEFLEQQRRNRENNGS